MMKVFKSLLIILALVLAVGLFAACTANENNEPAPTETPEVTEAPATAEPTEVPTPSPVPTEPPTPKPELGENKGKMFTEGQEGVEVLFFDDYEDKDVDDVLSDAAAFWMGDHMEVIDGKLCLAFVDGAPENQHQSYYPLLTDTFDDYEQFELSFDYKAAYTDPSLANYEWMGLMIGFFITEPTGRIADSAGDGLFIGINNKGSFPVYGIGNLGDDGGWPDHALTFNYGKKDLFSEEHHVTLVETNDHKAYLYIDGELICYVEITEKDVTLYDGTGKKIRSRKNDPENQAGASMMVWTHCTGAIIDNFTVKAY